MRLVLLSALLFVLIAASLGAQIVYPPGAVIVQTDPTGQACTNSSPLYGYNGNIYTCQSGVEALYAGGVSGWTCNGTTCSTSQNVVIGTTLLAQGGDPTGSADSTTFITTALTRAASGNSTTIAPGTYKVVSQISVTQTAPMNLFAYGVTISTTFADPGSPGAVVTVVPDGTNPINIFGLSFVHVKSGSPKIGTLDGLGITGAAAIKLTDMSATGLSEYGLSINGASVNCTRCNTSSNWYGGMNMSGASVSVVGGRADSNGETLVTNGYGLIIGTSTSGNGWVGGGFSAQHNKRYGIDARYAHNLVIDGVYIYDSGFIGIQAQNYLTSSGATASDIDIINSTIDNNSEASSDCVAAGTDSSGSNTPTQYGHLSVVNNTIKNCPSGAIYIQDGKPTSGSVNLLQKVAVAQNRISNSGAIPISIPQSWTYYGVDLLTITDNQVQDGGIVVWPGAGTTVLGGNTILLTSGTVANGIKTGSGNTAAINNNIVYVSPGLATTPLSFSIPIIALGNTINGAPDAANQINLGGTISLGSNNVPGVFKSSAYSTYYSAFSFNPGLAFGSVDTVVNGAGGLFKINPSGGPVGIGGGADNEVTCWKALADGVRVLGYATVAEITAGTCH